MTELAKNEPSKAVIDAIDKAINNTNAAKAGSDERPIQLPDYPHIDTNIAVNRKWLSLLKTQLANQLQKAKERLEQAIKEHGANNYRTKWEQDSCKALKRISKTMLSDALDNINTGQMPKNPHAVEITELINTTLIKEPDFGLHHIVNHLSCARQQIDLEGYIFASWLSFHSQKLTDLRQLCDVFNVCGLDLRPIASWILNSRWESSFSLPKIPGVAIWPFFYQNDIYLEEAFGIAESKSETRWRSFELAYGMLVVAQFEKIPAKYLLALYQHALSTGKTYGPLAQQILTDYGVVEERLFNALTSAKQDERVVAANWLAELKQTSAIKPLQQALKKEKRELPKAAMLNALYLLGDNIDKYLSSARPESELSHINQ